MLWASDTSGRVAIVSENWQDSIRARSGSDASGHDDIASEALRIHPEDNYFIHNRTADAVTRPLRVQRHGAKDYVWVDLHGVPARSTQDGSFSGYLGTAAVRTVLQHNETTPIGSATPLLRAYLGSIVALLEKARDMASAAGDHRLETVMDFALKVSLDRAG